MKLLNDGTGLGKFEINKKISNAAYAMSRDNNVEADPCVRPITHDENTITIKESHRV